MFRRRRPESDFSEELQAHLELEIDRLRADGLSEEDAYWQARRNLGNLGAAGERFYESGRPLWFEDFVQDVRHALRRLRKAPVFAVTAILTLALGIGATTSIFTLVHAVLLKTLSVPNPKDLYRLGKQTHCCIWGGYSQDKEFSIVSYDLYKHFRDNTKGFAQLAAFQAGPGLIGVRRAHGGTAAESYIGKFVSGNYFSMFGVNAYAGRALTTADDESGAPPAAVMSYRLWQRKYGLNPSVIGDVFNLNDKPFTIVGIAPPSFYGDTLNNAPPDLFLPLATEPLVKGDNSTLRFPNMHWLDLIGRVQPGVSPVSIETQMRVELQQWLRSHSGEMEANDRSKLARQTLYLSPGGAGIITMRENYEEWLRILMMVSGFVLLIVCANVANLMLVRGLERRQQTSLSMALGARPMRLVRQALTESVVLSILGGAAGLVVAYAGTQLILHFAFPSMPGFASVPISASPSTAVLAFGFAISLITGAVFGIAPAWMATRVDPIEALRSAGRSTSRVGSLPRKTLAVFQAALSLTLLSASGLLTAALRHLENQDFGFDQDRRTIVNIDPSLAGYKAEQLAQLYSRIHNTLTSVPGVKSVAICIYSPLNGDSWDDRVFVSGRPAPGPKEDNDSGWDRVTPGYFEAIGNPIIKGRPISDQDTAGSRHVAVVNEAFARRFFKNEDPIGKHFGRSDIATAGEFEIIGVAKDARYLTWGISQPVGPFVFLPASQYTVFPKPSDTVFDVRSHFLNDIVILMQPGAQLADSEVRLAMASVDPNMPVNFIRSLKDQVASNFSQQRLMARLTSLFGILSLVLASIGIYGVTAYSVGTRTNEIGVRMALGADQRSVLGLILRSALALIFFGLLLGMPLTLAAGRFLGSQLYGINQYDPAALGVAIMVVGISALIAALIPAFRASSISPVAALRAE